MTYRTFRSRCVPGTAVKDSERAGRIIKISKDGEKALVKFKDGMTECIEFSKIELI